MHKVHLSMIFSPERIVFVRWLAAAKSEDLTELVTVDYRAGDIDFRWFVEREIESKIFSASMK